MYWDPATCFCVDHVDIVSLCYIKLGIPQTLCYSFFVFGNYCWTLFIFLEKWKLCVMRDVIPNYLYKPSISIPEDIGIGTWYLTDACRVQVLCILQFWVIVLYGFIVFLTFQNRKRNGSKNVNDDNLITFKCSKEK